ncbi:hypothetical protein J6590_021421 [Homalodisca vitripennis]|nr:hypothetical protein J6590_021421 [Homalodisca vitripennis]
MKSIYWGIRLSLRQVNDTSSRRSDCSRDIWYHAWTSQGQSEYAAAVTTRTILRFTSALKCDEREQMARYHDAASARLRKHRLSEATTETTADIVTYAESHVDCLIIISTIFAVTLYWIQRLRQRTVQGDSCRVADPRTGSG